MEEIIKKAEILIEVLPYIKRFYKKITVIKYGGSILAEEKIRHSVLQDIVFLNLVGIRIVLVHGGGPSITERMRLKGKKTEFVDGMRITDEETLLVVEEELQKLNKIIVEELNKFGAKAVGLNGKEKGLIQVKKKRAKVDLGRVGEITAVDPSSILKEIKNNYIAVVLPMGRGPDNRIYNVNADEAASWIAVALKAEKLLFLTNVKGIMRNPEDPNSFISTLTVKEAKTLVEEKVIQEGMIPKVKASIYAIENGVKKTHIIDAKLSHSLLLEIFTNKGVGTEILI
ncbi:MAG: acetylglutamate kinase [Candidatus Omnitrophica bacterium]|nr:acetylglutamate kinase [Candidatus Omnitrophota bacterium]